MNMNMEKMQAENYAHRHNKRIFTIPTHMLRGEIIYEAV